MKSVTAAEAAALAAFRILDQSDRVGGLVFGDDVIAEVRPQRSRLAVNTFLSAIAAANARCRAAAPVVEPMSFNNVLNAVARILAPTGDLYGARAALNDALAANPSSDVLQSLLGEPNGVNPR